MIDRLSYPKVRGWMVLLPLLICELFAVSAAAQMPAGQRLLDDPREVLTNLSQLRQCSERKPLVLHPYRVVAEVLDADSANGVLVLRDASAVEFIRTDFQNTPVEPGATVSLEGSGCGARPEGFGLAIVPNLVVDNDGIHEMTAEAGKRFLHAGANPISVQWFNRFGNFGLKIEYKRAGQPRQKIPDSILSPMNRPRTPGTTNSSGGLDYRCYEGVWVRLPAFPQIRPVKAGVATNFDLGVRTRADFVGLEFDGFITVPRDDFYTFYVTSDDGSRLFVGESSSEVRVLKKTPAPRRAQDVPESVRKRTRQPWVTLEGIVKFAGIRGTGQEMVLQVGNDEIRVEVFQGREVALGLQPGAKVQVSGVYQDFVAEGGSQRPGLLRVSSWRAVRPIATKEMIASEPAEMNGTNEPVSSEESALNAIRVISNVAEIKSLPLAGAAQHFPVSIRGVVTAILPSFIGGVVIQDSTKGIFVSSINPTDLQTLQRGDFCRVDGVTGPGPFAPIIAADRITILGPGQMPHPVYPRRDELFNGSLDTQYVEIEGVVTAVNNQRLVMLTDGGMATLELTDFQSEDLARYQNSLIRVRGCAFAFFDPQTHQLNSGVLRVLSGTVDVLPSAPHDLFDAPQKSIGELLLYDPQADPFRRLKVRGQVIYSGADMHFLTDGTNGLRVTTGNSDVFGTGDLVEAVGFLDPEGPAAELKEAEMRKIGHAPLPVPTKLTPDHLLMTAYADTLVQVEATLVDHWRDGSEDMLRLQSGFLTFKAHLASGGQSISLPPSGSQLELTGAYAPAGNRAPDGAASSVELYLQSPAAIRVVATPPWWTLERVFILAGILTALLSAVVVWNKELQRQVQERGRRLEIEIQNRQRAEMQHAAETERSRIARDLHDELGTALTEVNLLASAGVGDLGGTEGTKYRFRHIAEKARSLISGLDVIVWAVDPQRDSIQSFADYLEIYAEELLAAGNIGCRLKIPIEFKYATLTGTARHSLLLAVMEALNNVVRHASAHEVELKVDQHDRHLEIVITDDGCGFDLRTVRLGDGLKNLRERMEALRGNCRIESSIGKGTTVQLSIPLDGD